MLSDLKAQAEALILRSNDIDGLLTCSLRPSNVFGPGDTELVPYFLNLARYGFAKVVYILHRLFLLVNSCISVGSICQIRKEIVLILMPIAICMLHKQ